MSNLIDREVAETLIWTSETIEEADEAVEMYLGKKSRKEKIDFIKDMFNVQIIDGKPDDPDEMTYSMLLNMVINKKWL